MTLLSLEIESYWYNWKIIFVILDIFKALTFFFLIKERIKYYNFQMPHLQGLYEKCLAILALKRNCNFGLKLWQMNDRIYVYPLGRTRRVDLVLSYRLKDIPFFKKSKFYTNMHIYDDRVIFLGITKLFSQSHVLWNVRVNSNYFQRCFFYRKRHFKWNLKTEI